VNSQDDDSSEAGIQRHHDAFEELLRRIEAGDIPTIPEANDVDGRLLAASRERATSERLRAIAEAKGRGECDHAAVTPVFDLEASRGLDEYEVRRRWPRFWGQCPTCLGHVIAYASFEHYIAGDW